MSESTKITKVSHWRMIKILPNARQHGGERSEEDCVKTKITKVSEKKIFIERFFSGDRIKFSGSYLEMPEELLNEPIGTEIFPEEYETGQYDRDGIAIWYHENGNVYKKYNYIDGWLDGLYEIYWENGDIRVKGERATIGDRKEVRVGTWLSYDEDGNVDTQQQEDKRVVSYTDVDRNWHRNPKQK